MLTINGQEIKFYNGLARVQFNDGYRMLNLKQIIELLGLLK